VLKILADTCFWRALVDKRDQNHKIALKQMDIIIKNKHTILIPWPTMYETLKTKFVKDTYHMSRFIESLAKIKPEYVDDSKWRDSCFKPICEKKCNHASLVDAIILSIIEDKSIHIDNIITYDEHDFGQYSHLILIDS
jgi:predicted nucleic acid-binding protein